MATARRALFAATLGALSMAATAGAQAVTMPSTISSGHRLLAGQELDSAGGNDRLVLQGDGNLVIYDRANHAIWASGTTGPNQATSLIVGAGGDVTLRTSSGRIVWSTKSAATAPATLAIQDDGNLVLYAQNQSVLWSKNSGLVLPDGLSSANGAAQLVVVTSPSASSTTGTLTTFEVGPNGWQQAWSAMASNNGFNGWRPGSQRTEGDGTTPEGIFSIGATMYGNAPNPGVLYAYHRLIPGDYWDENPSSAQYNTFQERPGSTNCASNPFGRDTECLWQETGPYPYFAVINFNTPPTGATGSGVFLHLGTGPTAGCVSLHRADLLRVLRWLNPRDHPAIVLAGPSALRQY